ncbi:MAG: purine-nucleoside phosphorylase [Lachnospiraceae bacterium]|nr:purine-nucleoside phosphorylase [Lachnospiraceae bacterium]
MADEVYGKLLKCYECIRKRTDFKPLVALVLGSGLGDYAKSMTIVDTIPYNEIEGFPVSTVIGHAGQFVLGYVENVPVICMQGRVHFYEGYPVSDVVLPTRLMYKMGAKYLFLTNASGGINSLLKAGDLMMIKDHISLFAPNPLIGPNIEELGTRFPDMSHVYDPKLQELIRKTASELSIDLKEGVYAQLTGPSFESPAEIQLLKHVGADAVGMSTVVEAIAANHMGMRILAISCVCNMAAGISPTPLTHEEVQQAASECAPLFKKLVTGTILKIGKNEDAD